MGLFSDTLRRLPGGAGLSRRGMLGVVAFSALLLAACSAGVQTTKVGDFDVAPDFQLAVFENINHQKGELVSLSGFAGKPVVVNFWYPSCGPCRLEVPHLEEASRNHKGDVKFLAAQVSGFDSAEEGQAFVDELGLTFSIGFAEDPQIVADYKIIGFPSSVFLNQRHEIVRTWGGALNLEKLEELIQELLQ